MIAIQLKSISVDKINEIISLFNHEINDDFSDNLDMTIEERITTYLSSDTSNKLIVENFFKGLGKEEFIETLALYYFYSKLTYDTDIITDDQQLKFWDLCIINAKQDVERIGFSEMKDFLKEKPNLAIILTTASLNLN